MSLVLDIGQGAGLAGATGARPFLPPLLAGALARGDLGVDFEGTSWDYLESPWFLAALFALAVVAYGLDRAGREPPATLFPLVGVAAGALLFAGSVDEEWGIAAGLACSALAYRAVAPVLSRARGRIEDAGPGLLHAYADGAALALAGLSVLAPPIGFLGIAAFAWLLVSGRRAADRKYEGLRILR